MLTACETYLLAHYLANVASGLRRRDPEAQALVEWMADKESHIRFGSRGRRRRPRFRACHEDEVSRQRFRSLRQTLQAERPTRRPRRDRTGQRLLNLAQTTGLSRTDAAILELLVRYQTHSIFPSLVDDVLISPSRWHDVNIGGRALPLLLGHSAGAIVRRLHGDAPLIRTGLVSVDEDGDMKAIDRLNRLARAPAEAGSEVNRLLFDVAPRTDLQWSDYDHVAGDRDHVETLLKGALERGEPGVNILLHGPPGTGKTEFCKAVAERLGVTLYSVGETDEDGREPSRRERQQELRLAQRLLSQDSRSLLLFDEMDDLLGDGLSGLLGLLFGRRSRGNESKVFMHRLLEQAPAPTLWTINGARDVSPTILRRMMFAFELRPPTGPVRERVWQRQLARNGIEADAADVRSLAVEFDVTPGVAAGAILKRYAAACAAFRGFWAARRRRRERPCASIRH